MLDRAALERLLEASPDIVVATSASGEVVYYNDGAERTLGYTRDEVIGQHVTRFYPSLEEAQLVMAAMRDPEDAGAGRVESFRTRYVTKDGREVQVAISGVILCDAEGKEQGTIGFAKDVTEMVRRDQLAVMGEIAVGLSHKINSPLETILNELALIERGKGDVTKRLASIRASVSEISAQLSRLQEMAELKNYSNTAYLGERHMIDLSESASGSAYEGNQASPLEGARILVVDDDPGVRRTLAELLESDGSSVSQAENGLDAMRKLEQDQFDLVLSDVVMPDMDGYDLYQESRRLYPELPVALMTGFYYDHEHVIKRSRLKGLESVLFKKPVDPDRLRQTLGEMLRPPPPVPS